MTATAKAPKDAKLTLAPPVLAGALGEADVPEAGGAVAEVRTGVERTVLLLKTGGLLLTTGGPVTTGPVGTAGTDSLGGTTGGTTEPLLGTTGGTTGMLTEPGTAGVVAGTLICGMEG
jgi:hypothetical protein